MTDKTGEFKDQYKQQVEGFKVEMFAEHRKKQKEHEEFKDVIDKLVGARDTRSRELVREFERLKKHTIDAVEKNPELATAKIKARGRGLEGQRGRAARSRLPSEWGDDVQSLCVRRSRSTAWTS